MKNLPLVFYHKMGELFYALVASQIPVNATEFAQLRKLVSNTWKAGPAQSVSQIATLKQIEIALEWFDYENLDANDSFDSFKAYFKEYPEFYTKERKMQIWNTAKAVAVFFAPHKDVENSMFIKLENLLNEEV